MIDYAAIIDEYTKPVVPGVPVGDGAALLDCVSSYIRRYVAASEPQVAVLALWAVHTHLLSEIDCTAYLAITSAEKQSGKTRLLDVLGTLVKNPWTTGQVSPAVLFRTVDKKQPTLLLDESDAAFNGDKEYAEALRGILNTGYQRGGVASRCVGKDFDLKDFSTFCPKAIAGIGKLPGTVADRAIPIRLKRAPRGTVKKFRKRDVELEAFNIRTAIELFADAIKSAIALARPTLPEELSDRQQDSAESLVAIADLTGGDWPGRARTSLVSLCVEAQDNDDSIGHTLLSDIRLIFDSKAVGDISSSDLAKALAAVETSPWNEWSQGRAISPAKVTRLLKPYGIKPQHLRACNEYLRNDFEEAWSLYLRPQTSTTSTSAVTTSIESTSSVVETSTPKHSVEVSNPAKSNGSSRVEVVEVSKPPEVGYAMEDEGYHDQREEPSYTVQDPSKPGLDCTCNSCTGRFRTVAGWRYHIVGKRCTPAAKAAD